MSATHSYPWQNEQRAEQIAKMEIAGQVVAALAAKDQTKTLDAKERATYDAAMDCLMKVLK